MFANIVLEGPKASGKSTIANHFINKHYEYYHSSAETKNDFNYHLELLAYKGKKKIIDRFSIGEMIYPSIYKRKGKLTFEQFLFLMNKRNTLYIILYASNVDTLTKRITKRDFDKDIDFESLVNSNICFTMMAHNLKNCFENVRVFDVSKIDAEEIIKELENEFTKI